MNHVILSNSNKYLEKTYTSENAFEKKIRDNSALIFGEKAIYLNQKSLLKTKALGGVIPDGFLFDFRDEENPEFYIVEIELEKHGFYRHIFPQLTKFFAFYQNQSEIDTLVSTLFNDINSNPAIKQDFDQYLKKRELHKTLKDTLENSQNVLVLIDENKPEFQEMMTTYTDTWGRKLKVMIIKEFTHENHSIILVSPDFEKVPLGEIKEKPGQDGVVYGEEYHIAGMNEVVKTIYSEIKKRIMKTYPNLTINPQKYYISLREKRNFTYLKPLKTRMNIVIMTPLETGKEIIKYHAISELGSGVQNFYNGPCYRVTIKEPVQLDEIMEAITKAYQLQ